MNFALISTSGNVLEWFHDEGSARAALASMVAEAPEAAAHVDLAAFDEAGNPVDLPDAPAPQLWWSGVNLDVKTAASVGVAFYAQAATIIDGGTGDLLSVSTNESDERFRDAAIA